MSNRVYIYKSGLGYWVKLNDGVRSIRPWIPHPNYKEAKEFNFYELIQSLLNVSAEFYAKEVEVDIEKHPTVKIDPIETQTIEALVDKLHKISKENSDLVERMKKAMKELVQDHPI